jgi:hypothetical protein
MLGWLVADLFYTPMPKGSAASPPDTLPSASAVDPLDACRGKLDHVEALVGSLGVAAVSTAWASEGQVLKAAVGDANDESWITHLRAFHIALLLAFEAYEFALFRGYDLGRSLRKTCRLPNDFSELKDTFAAGRVTTTQEHLGDLADFLPKHAANAVAASIGVWATWLDEAQTSATSEGDYVREARRRLTRQGHLWLAILCGEKQAVNMLDPTNYVAASRRLSSKLAGITTRLLLTYWWQVMLLALAIAGVIVTVVLSGKTASVVASLGALAAALGITRKGVVAEGEGALKLVTEALWGAELDLSIGDAITKLPRRTSRRGTRDELPVKITRVPAAGPDPEALPVASPPVSDDVAVTAAR